jgi:hypothetical protein
MEVAKEMKIASLPWTNVSIHVEETSQKLKAFAQKLCVTVARPCFLRPKAAFPSLKKVTVVHHLGTAMFGTSKG